MAEARRLILEGYYDRATEKLDEAGRDESSAVEVAVARVDIDERLGRYRAAIERLRAVEARGRTSAEWHASLAAMLAEVGEYEAAVEAGRDALNLAPGHFRARYILGRVLETLGREQDAIATYKPFDDVLKRKLPDGADELMYLGRGFIRYSLLIRHPDIQMRLQHTLREVYQEALDYVDAKYWPAWLAIADLEAETHKRKDAEEDFQKIRQINAKAFEADVGLARLALEDWNFELIEQRVNAALEINPNSVAGQLVLAQSRMLERRYADAAKCAQRALKVNPRSIEAPAKRGLRQEPPGCEGEDILAAKCGGVDHETPAQPCLHNLSRETGARRHTHLPSQENGA